MLSPEENEFSIEYLFELSADAEERLAEAYDLILTLILKELQPKNQDGEECSTPSA